MAISVTSTNTDWSVGLPISWSSRAFCLDLRGSLFLSQLSCVKKNMELRNRRERRHKTRRHKTKRNKMMPMKDRNLSWRTITPGTLCYARAKIVLAWEFAIRQSLIGLTIISQIGLSVLINNKLIRGCFILGAPRIKTKPTPASLPFKGQVTKHTTVKCSLVIRDN